jgi:hypothetical protein
MNTFTKWFLINAVMGTAIFFAETKDAISTIVQNDLSHISILIMVLYVVVSGYIGRLCYLSDKISTKNSKNRQKEKEYLK